MFIGEYAHTLDEKGRLSLPAKFRREIQDGIVVTRGLDGCLFTYPQAEWEIMARKLAGLPLSSPDSRAFTRLMLAGACDGNIDSQGRIMIPEYLRQYAGLGKNAIVTGLYNRIEIWNEDSWNEYKTRTERNTNQLAEAMTQLGI